MPVIHAPTWFDWPVLAHGLQRYGHFVLFRFDSLASVASLDDAEASRAASLLPQDWFLGIVIKNAGFMLENAKGVHLLNLSIYLVGVGPPEPTSAAIPISPAPQLADSHPPIQLPSELPWLNLYAHSFHTVAAVVSRLHDGPDHFSDSITDEQLRTLRSTVSEDLYHRHDDVWEAMVRNVAARNAAAKSAAAKPSRSATPEASGSESGDETDSGGSEDFMLSGDAQLITEKYGTYRLHIELWLDPASCPGQPAPPSACEALKTRLNEIAKEWYDRKIEEAKGLRSRLIADWNQRVRDAGGERAVTHATEVGPEGSFDDEIVSPEDAVDYHLEQRTREEGVPDHQNTTRPPEAAAAREDDASASKADVQGQRARGSTGVASPSAPPGLDSKQPPKSPVHAPARLALTKRAAFEWLRAVIPGVKARILRDP